MPVHKYCVGGDEMEYLVDRTRYRRQANSVKNDVDENKLVYKLIKKLLIQMVAGIIVLTVIYTAKVLDIQNFNDFMIEEVNREVPLEVVFEDLKNSALNIYRKIFKEQVEEIKEPVFEEDIINSEDIVDPILSIEANDVFVTEEAIEGINQMSDDANFIRENYHFICPIQGKITSKFGARESDNPIVTSYHSGIDIAGNTGTKIKSALDGIVTKASKSEAYGNYIIIKTEDVETLYAHCSKLNVKENQKVKQGDIIGEVGSTGWATGPHLHFEIRLNNRLVNPADVLNFGE